jgi:mRNA interferase YafQ
MRTIYATPTFVRLSRDMLRKNPMLKKKWSNVVKLLEKDVFHPLLKTHKLHGALKDLYACSVSYDTRITFTFDERRIMLKGIGTHDEIY